jgi:leucyl aminopeptidase (aminopeptidase T)
MDAWEAAKNALECVLEARKGENVAIFCDHEKMDVGEAFTNGALKLGLKTRLVPLKTTANVYQEVPETLMEIITKRTPDIYINLLRGGREETPFRIRLIRMETEGGKSRLGHCPGVTLDMLTEGAMALTSEEHRQMQGFAERLNRKLSRAVKVKTTSPAGTDVSMSVEGRPFFTDTKIDWNLMKWMNLPTGEVTVAPVEDSLEGKLVCDMCIGGIGRIDVPVEINATKGRVSKVFSAQTKILRGVESTLNTDEWSSTVGEFAFGINPKARFINELLEAEKIFGTIHIAFGNNSDMPNGKNKSRNHMDFLVSKPTVRVFNEDGASFDVLVDGVFQRFYQ